MNSASNQMPIDEPSRRLPQFVNANQQYEFNRLFYGVSIGPAAFSAFMSKSFRPYVLNKDLINNLDKVFIHPQKTRKKIHFKTITTKSFQGKMKTAPNKPYFFLIRVKFPGHSIEGITINTFKITIRRNIKTLSPSNKENAKLLK